MIAATRRPIWPALSSPLRYLTIRIATTTTIIIINALTHEQSELACMITIIIRITNTTTTTTISGIVNLFIGL